MKKRPYKFERDLNAVKDILRVLDREGDKPGSQRYKEFVAFRLLLIEDSLRRIGLALFGLLGFLAGKFISGLF